MIKTVHALSGSPKTIELSAFSANILPVLLLLWLFFIPLAALIYTSWSYPLNCHWNPRCEQLGTPKVELSSHELARFFRHQLTMLPTPAWSEKELQHLTEVRGIYDQVFWLFMVITALFILDLFISKQVLRYRRYALHSRNLMLGLLVLMLAISPFFRFFWMEVFHPLVFSNELWRTDPKDISWYLMPGNYFLRVILFLLASTLLLNQLLIFLLPKDKNR